MAGWQSRYPATINFILHKAPPLRNLWRPSLCADQYWSPMLAVFCACFSAKVAASHANSAEVPISNSGASRSCSVSHGTPAT